MSKTPQKTVDEAENTVQLPDIRALIAAAVSANENAQRLETQAQVLHNQVRDANNDARAAWDAIYEALIALKADYRTVSSFQSSKLGQMLGRER